LKLKHFAAMADDDYFTSKNWRLKIRQTAIAIIGWLGVFLPFICIYITLKSPKIAKLIHIKYYADIVAPIEFLIKFFAVIFVLIAIIYLFLTFYNNHYFISVLTKKRVINQERRDHHKKLIEDGWTQKFGDSNKRRQQDFYSVKPEQDLETDFSQQLFKKRG
jgi:hypothetical protein